MYFRKHSINQEKQSQTGESVIHLAGLWVVTSGDIPWEVFLGLMLFLGSDPGKHIINSFTFQDRFINQTYKTRIKPRIWVCLHAQSLSHVRLFATPWTVACQAPLSLKFSRQEYWCGLPFPPSRDLPNRGIKHGSPVSLALAGRFFIIFSLLWQLKEEAI